MTCEILVRQVFTFTLLWISYCGCYLLRKPFGIVKDQIQDDLQLTDDKMGYFDLSFALPYSLGSLLFGFLGDKFGAKITLGISLIFTSLSSVVMGMIKEFYQLCLLMFISGFFQALCWPTACSIVATWFKKSNLSIVIALFASCTAAGGMLSSVITVHLEKIGTWRNVFLIPSICVGVIGIVILIFVREKDHIENFITEVNDVNLEFENFNNEEKLKTPKFPSQIIQTKNRALSVLQVLKIQFVPEISLGLAFNKGVRTAVMFWLPMYLTRVYNFDAYNSGLIPITYEVGGLIGATPVLILFNKFFKISDEFTCFTFNLLSTLVFIIFIYINNLNSVYMHILLFLSGIFTTIVEVLLCGSIPAKMGDEVNSKSSVIGVINGIGSMGNVAEGPLIAWLSYYYGMKVLMIFFAISCFLSAQCTLRKWWINRNINIMNNAISLNNSPDHLKE